MVRGVGADRILFGTDSPLYESMAFPTLLQAADITEDERDSALEDVQKSTDEHIKKMDELLAAKEKEIMEV